jgi:hypothetical protein
MSMMITWRMSVVLLDSESRRGELSRRGIARAQQFTWDRTAAATLALYASCLGGSTRVG